MTQNEWLKYVNTGMSDVQVLRQMLTDWQESEDDLLWQLQDAQDIVEWLREDNKELRSYITYLEQRVDVSKPREDTE